MPLETPLRTYIYICITYIHIHTHIHRYPFLSLSLSLYIYIYICVYTYTQENPFLKQPEALPTGSRSVPSSRDQTTWKFAEKAASFLGTSAAGVPKEGGSSNGSYSAPLTWFGHDERQV